MLPAPEDLTMENKQMQLDLNPPNEIKNNGTMLVKGSEKDEDTVGEAILYEMEKQTKLITIGNTLLEALLAAVRTQNKMLSTPGAVAAAVEPVKPVIIKSLTAKEEFANWLKPLVGNKVYYSVGDLEKKRGCPSGRNSISNYLCAMSATGAAIMKYRKNPTNPSVTQSSYTIIRAQV